uniref:Uncharacterized protein n=1 Tax=Anopheles arabiensis TaxID=7173 RepID=A0A182IF04_ANOAR
REVHTRVAAHAGAVCCVTICSVFVFCVLAASVDCSKKAVKFAEIK